VSQPVSAAMHTNSPKNTCFEFIILNLDCYWVNILFQSAKLFLNMQSYSPTCKTIYDFATLMYYRKGMTQKEIDVS